MHAPNNWSAHMRLASSHRNDFGERSAFNRLVSDIFGVHFERWHSLGFWDDRYRCYSLMDGTRAVANVSVSAMRLAGRGGVAPALQFGAVAVEPSYRGRGLARLLMERTLAEYEREYDTMFLFANDSVLDFYQRFGFRRVAERSFCCGAAALAAGAGRAAPPDGRKLDMANPADVRLAAGITAGRTPVSRVLGALDCAGIAMWHLLNALPDCVVYYEAQQAVVVAERDNETLHVYDVVAADAADMASAVRQAVAADGAERVVFHFTPDVFDLGNGLRSREDWSGGLFVRGSWPIAGGEAAFPATAKT